MRTKSVAIFFLLFAFAAFAQTDRGTITGTITDPASAVIPNAQVQARSVETGSVYNAASSSTGNYSLTQLPAGTFGGRGTEIPPIQRNLAFRNLTRANMVHLASGQQMAKFLGVTPLTEAQILEGNQGAVLTGLSDEQRAAVLANTPLWFYILREAEFNNGLLGGVGGRIVAEVFHRAMEGSRTSIVRDPSWRPTLGPDRKTFRMTDLLLFAFEGKADLLNPLGD